MCNQPREAMAVYRRMLEEGYSPNSTTYNALISAYGKAGQLDKVMEVFQVGSAPGCRCTPLCHAEGQPAHWMCCGARAPWHQRGPSVHWSLRPPSQLCPPPPGRYLPAAPMCAAGCWHAHSGMPCACPLPHP